MRFKEFIQENRLEAFEKIPNFRFHRNPKYKKSVGRIYKHVTKKKNMKSIFQKGLIPSATKGWLESTSVWLWTDPVRMMTEKFKSKTEIIILFQAPKEQVEKMPTVPAGVIREKQSVQPEQVIGALEYSGE